MVRTLNFHFKNGGSIPPGSNCFLVYLPPPFNRRYTSQYLSYRDFLPPIPPFRLPMARLLALNVPPKPHLHCYFGYFYFKWLGRIRIEGWFEPQYRLVNQLPPVLPPHARLWHIKVSRKSSLSFVITHVASELNLTSKIKWRILAKRVSTSPR